MPRGRTTTEWTESASGDNSAATATHSAESGNVHYLTYVSASYTGDNTSGDLTISDGSTTIITVTVHEAEVINLPWPVKITTGNKVEASLAASGTAGDVGNVAIGGFTRAE